MSDSEIVGMLLKGRDDLAWFNANLDRIKSEHDNRFVAFSDKRIIGSDSNLDNLMRKLKDSGLDPADVFVEFVSKVKFIL